MLSRIKRIPEEIIKKKGARKLKILSLEGEPELGIKEKERKRWSQRKNCITGVSHKV